MRTISKMTVSFVLSTVFANTAQGAFDETYKELNSKAGVRCSFYKEDPSLKRISDRLEFGSHIISHYKYQENFFSVQVVSKEVESFWGKKEKGIVELKMGETVIDGEVTKKNFIKFNLKALTQRQNSIVSQLKLRSLSCAVEIAVEKRHKITNNHVHINVHPHTQYDAFDRATPRVNEFFSNQSLEQIVLLDDYNRKAERSNIVSFLKGGMSFNYKELTSSENIDFPSTHATLVSPAGHNNYAFNQPYLTVEFSGGNHNYCMWNNTRRILDAFFRGENNNKISINYNKNAIVVQRTGIIDGISVDRSIYNQTNLLSDVFQMMKPSDLQKYHTSYYNYFKTNFLTQKKHLFSKVKISYNGSTSFTEEVEGAGDREFIIELNYL